MQLDNPRYIKAEDHPEEMQESINTIAAIINPFMQQVVDLSNKRVGFDNLTFNLTTFEIQLDSTGKVVGNNQINFGSTSIQGFSIINAQNTANTSTTPTAQPFIAYSSGNNGTTKISKITGLPAGKWRITVIVF